MTLRARLVWAAAGAVAVTVALVVLVVFWAERRELRLLVDAELRRSAEQLSAELLVSGEVDDTLRPEPLGTLTTYAQVVTADGEIIPLTRARAVLPVDARSRAAATGDHDRFYADAELDGTTVRTLTVPVAGGALQVARTVDDIDRHLLDVGALLALVGVGGIGLAILLGHAVAGTALRPVARLSSTAEHIAETRDLAARLEVRGDDGLSRLGRTINRMLAALETSVRSQRQLVADASHELRTPLSSVRANLDVLERTDHLDGRDRGALIADLRTEVESLVSAVDDLLTLSRDEAGGGISEELAVEQVVEEALARARRRGPDIRIDAHLQPCVARGDRVDLLRAVTNLLDNALKWTPPDRPVEVRLDAVELSVRDHGPGIAPDDLPHVFERFYRAPAARSRPGAGLGLAIVRKVTGEHGWSVTAENAEPGARLRLRFAPAPAAPQQHRSRTGGVWVGALLVAVSLIGVFGLPVLAAGVPSQPTTVSGILEPCGESMCVNGRIVDFGPRWHVAAHDYDGDGTRGTTAEEIAGLRGREVVLEVEPGTEPAAVLTVDGLPYRDLGVPPAASPAPSSDAPVLRGTLERCGADWCVADTVLDFGPVWYVTSTDASQDYDGDGTREAIAEETAGLEGEQVVLDVDQGGAAVMSIDGMPYRPAHGPPPWAGGPLN